MQDKAENLLVSTLARRCNRGSHTKHGGPGSDIIVSMKSFTVTFPPYITWYKIYSQFT